MGESTRRQRRAHQTEILVNCSLLDRDEFADPSLDEAHRKHASVGEIVVECSAGAACERGPMPAGL